mgnify:CR=1 FL=1
MVKVKAKKAVEISQSEQPPGETLVAAYFRGELVVCETKFIN